MHTSALQKVGGDRIQVGLGDATSAMATRTKRSFRSAAGDEENDCFLLDGWAKASAGSVDVDP